MSFTLTKLPPQDIPHPDTISSLIFHVPFLQDAPDKLRARYETLKAERGIEENENYTEVCARIALEAYLEGIIALERQQWCADAKTAFEGLVRSNRKSLRHVEIILPGWGIAEPLDLMACLADAESMESFCVQWPLTGFLPLTLLLNASWSHILFESTLLASYTAFLPSLTSILAKHAATLQRLRISLPQSNTYTTSPFASLSLSEDVFPALPKLEILDLTHWSPDIPALIALLSDSTRLPALRHLILDQGGEISLSDFEDDDEEDFDSESEQDLVRVERSSWAALGTCLSSRKPKLISLCASLHNMRRSFWPVGMRMTPESLRDALAADVGDLNLCTAWPTPTANPSTEADSRPDDADLYTHAEGCGHLAYLPEQRPTVGLWPPLSSDNFAMAMLGGKPWY
ncbi:hypothetical protein C8F01DRAFT_1144388 [Mycena amicta]|nr:hypothetical protein C8F01DRAFT_1144388 [Mycena amicta]